MNQDILVEVKNLKKSFAISQTLELKSLDNLTFDILRGETFSLVGESGSGKTACGRTLTHLFPPTDGTILYDGKDVSMMTYREKKRLRQKAQLVFQNPYASLDSNKTISDMIAEEMGLHFPAHSRLALQIKIRHALHLTGLNSEHGDLFPYDLSDDQLQRVTISRVLAMNPEFIVCEEPVTASDGDFQARIISLLKGLQKELGLTFLFISHSLSMVKSISDHIGIMYLGTLVELTTPQFLSSKTQHPYTTSLIFASNRPRSHSSEVGMTSPYDTPTGCKFYPICTRSMTVCHTELPEMIEVELDHFVACHLYS